MKEKNSILIACRGRDGSRDWMVLNRNIIAFYFHSLKQENCFRVGGCLMSMPMWYHKRFYCTKVVSSRSLPGLPQGLLQALVVKWAAQRAENAFSFDIE